MGVLLGAGMWACSDSVAPPPPPPPSPPEPLALAVVSEPVNAPLARAGVRFGPLTTTHTVESVAYISLSPGSVSRGNTLSIKNLRTAGSLTVPLVDGGTDPVRMAASAGDTLELIAVDSSGASARFLRVVPARRPPTVVRTRPPGGGRNVPLNFNIGAVFSEPILISTVTSGSIVLTLDGAVVPGSLVPSADGLTVDYVLAEPLQPNRDYSLRVTQAVRDLSGETLDEPIEARFTTAGGGALAGSIVFARGSGMNIFSPDYVTDIWTARADASVQRNLTNHPANDNSPTWSPDGLKIAFVSDRLGARAIFVMNADGSDARRLVPGAFEDFSPAWSPDGTRIAFARKTGTFEAQIFVAAADGSGAVAITAGQGLRYGASWSPDGKRIAYAHHAHSGTAYLAPNIEIAAADGTGSSAVTGFPPSASTCPFARDPAWSPDGATILMYGCPLGPGMSLGVYQMRPDGGGIARVSASAEVGWDPEWTDGGERIIFVKDRKLYSMTAQGREIIQVTFGSDADQQPGWRP